MKVSLVRVLVALSFMVTGLSFPLTILHATMIGFSTGNWVLSPRQFLSFISGAGLLPWMLVSAVMYVTGTILLVMCAKTSKTRSEDKQEDEISDNK